MPLSRRTMLAAPLVLAPALLVASGARSQALWPGSRYNERQRERAIRRGLEFLYRTARHPRHFNDYGDDLLWCFYSMSRATADADIRKRAWTMGQERARHWRRLYPRVSRSLTAADLTSYAYGSYAADCLNVADARMKIDVQTAARLFRPADVLKFDPTVEAIPTDVPAQCAHCQSNNPRGRVQCRRCGRTLTMSDPYDLLCDALVVAYVWDSYGATFGAGLADVMQLVPKMRPYDQAAKLNYERFSSMAYAITHVVYVLNDYSVYRLKPEWLPQEFAFLKDHLQRTIDEEDAELTGEFLDSLKSFGLTQDDPVIRAGVEYVLSEQNDDGSWGDPETGDIYDVYHPTWTAICGLMDYAWKGEGVSFPEVLRRAGAV